MDELIINAEYDNEARVWVAEHDGLGLATEAESLDVLTYKLQEMIPELARLNGLNLPSPIRFSIVSHRQALAFA
jgi:hypothetical protein